MPKRTSHTIEPDQPDLESKLDQSVPDFSLSESAKTVEQRRGEAQWPEIDFSHPSAKGHSVGPNDELIIDSSQCEPYIPNPQAHLQTVSPDQQAALVGTGHIPNKHELLRMQAEADANKNS